MAECEHEYYPLRESAYYKLDSSGALTGIGLPKMDQTISYRKLYCRKCGATKEVVAQDHRRNSHG